MLETIKHNEKNVLKFDKDTLQMILRIKWERKGKETVWVRLDLPGIERIRNILLTGWDIGCTKRSAKGRMDFFPIRIMEDGTINTDMTLATYLRLLDKDGNTLTPLQIGGKDSFYYTYCFGNYAKYKF